LSILPGACRYRVNILLLQIKRIGDLILTTPAIAALREKFPKANLTLIASREDAPLLPAIADVDRTLIIQRKLSDVKIFRTVSREKFDYCVDFTRNDRSAALAFLSRARQRIVSDRIKLHSRLRASAYNEFVDCGTREMHTVDYNLALLRPLGIRDALTTPKLELPPSIRDHAAEVRHSSKIDSSFVIFHPGSARVEKFWDPARWAEVIEHTRSVFKLQPLLTSGDSALERKHIAEIKRKFSQPVVDLAGKTDLLTLTALIAQAQLVVTVDSAPMHLASAMQTQQIVLFGPTNPFHWRPRGGAALILQGRSASPLTEFSPDQPRHSMNDISTKAVIDAMNALLSAPAAQVS
jgi:predicted lipopolysaccharide heptosyltransferase III